MSQFLPLQPESHRHLYLTGREDGLVTLPTRSAFPVLGFTPTVSPVDLVVAVAVDARVAEALVDLGEAGVVVIPARTHAFEAVDAVDAGAAVVAGFGGALVDVDVTHGA